MSAFIALILQVPAQYDEVVCVCFVDTWIVVSQGGDSGRRETLVDLCVASAGYGRFVFSARNFQIGFVSCQASLGLLRESAGDV